MQHLDEGTIHAWLDGALPPLDAEQVAKHAAECVSCAAAVAEARGIIAGSARIVSALDDVPGGVIPGRTTRGPTGSSAWGRLRLTPGRAALAATILLAVSTTLTLRSSSSPSIEADSGVTADAIKPATPAAAPLARSVTLDSIKVPAGVGGARASVASASNRRPQKTEILPAPRAQTVGERRETTAQRRDVADAAAAAAPDTTTRVLAKARVAAQEVVARASAAAPPSVAGGLARGNVVPAPTALAAQRADSVNTFAGCYSLSADSSSGTEMPRGLPASFALTRPSPESRQMDAARRAFFVSADSTKPPLVWRQLSSTEASVTFSSAGNQPVSLVLTAGSPVGVASSGDRTVRVRVTRAPCRP